MSVPRITLTLMMLLVVFSPSHIVWASTQIGINVDTTPSFLANAEDALVSGYQAVLNAERSGANVTGLLVQLNGAGELLTQAHMAYSSGNFSEAIRLANHCRDIGEDVQNRAAELKDSTSSQNVQRMLLTMITSVVSVALIFLGSLWVWRFLKKRYGYALALPK